MESDAQLAAADEKMPPMTVERIESDLRSSGRDPEQGYRVYGWLAIAHSEIIAVGGTPDLGAIAVHYTRTGDKAVESRSYKLPGHGRQDYDGSSDIWWEDLDHRYTRLDPDNADEFAAALERFALPDPY